MLGKIFGWICLIASIFGVFCGHGAEMGSGILDGVNAGIRVCLSLCGILCFWGGIMEVLTKAGIIGKISKLLLPLLRLLFPEAARTGEGLEEISANLTANLLGLGNAATPLALRAMKKLQEHNPHPTVATGEQITLAVLNTASFSLLPSTLLSLLRSAGSANPFAVILPIWIVSLCSSFFALFLCCSFSYLSRKSTDFSPTRYKKRQNLPIVTQKDEIRPPYVKKGAEEGKINEHS